MADVFPELNQPEVPFMQGPFGSLRLETSRGRIGRLAGCQPGSIADAMNVRVDSDGINAEGELQDDIGTLATDSRQTHQSLASLRHHAVKLFQERFAEAVNALRLAVVQTARFNGGCDFRLRKLQHRPRRPSPFEQRLGSEPGVGIA